MKNKRNIIIATVLVVTLIVSIFVINTVANTDSASLSVEISEETLSAGSSATVTVKATTNFPVATVSIPVFYDKTLVSVSDVTANMTGYAKALTNTDAAAVGAEKIYADTGLESSKFGFVLVTYIAGAGETVANFNDSTVLTFTVTALNDVSGDAVIKSVEESIKTSTNTDGMLYFGTTTGTDINTMPKVVENIDVSAALASVYVGSSTTEITAKTEKTGVVDAENKYVYGITPGTNVEDYFTVTGGTIELVANSAGKTNGTGAVLNVKNGSGTVVDTYTVIIFGDVNGDGEIKGADLNDVNLCLLAGTTDAFNEVQVFAADVTGDGEIKAADKNDINLCLTSGSYDSITVNPYK